MPAPKTMKEITQFVLHPYYIMRDLKSNISAMRQENKKMKYLTHETKKKHKAEVNTVNRWAIAQGAIDSARPLLIKYVGFLPLMGALGTFFGLGALSSYIGTKCRSAQGSAYGRIGVQTRATLAENYLKSNQENAEQYKVQAPNVSKAVEDFVITTAKSKQSLTALGLSSLVLFSINPVSAVIIGVTAFYSGARALFELKALKEKQDASIQAQNHLQLGINKFIDADSILNETNNTTMAMNKIQENVNATNNCIDEYYKKELELSNKNILMNNLIGTTAWGSALIAGATAGVASGSYFVGGAAFAAAMMSSDRILVSIQSYIYEYTGRVKAFREYETNMQGMDYSKAKVRTGEKELSTSNGHLKVQGVDFSYEDSGRGISGISLDFHKGQVAVITGESGSGKSTLFDLLRHKLDPNKGEITLDDMPLTDLRQESVNSQIAYIAQKPVFLKGTIADEMQLFNDKATPQKMQQCLVRAGLKELDIHTPVYKEDGTSALSGGQMQRVAIARALVKDAPILLMDEPTTGLDATAKDEVWATIQSLKKDKTIVIVSHDSYEIMNADRAVLLEGGKITKDGNPSNLQSAYFDRMRQKASEVTTAGIDTSGSQNSGLKSTLEGQARTNRTEQSEQGVPDQSSHAFNYQFTGFLSNSKSGTR